MGTSDDVLLVWFGDPARDRDDLERDMRRWYAGGDDEAARLAGFRPDVERALRGELDAWADGVRGRLALVLLLDQLTRTVYAGTARAFAGDARAVALARDAFDRGLDRELSFAERHFLIMPLLHSERVADVERAGREFARNAAASPPWARFLAEAGVEQSQKYADVLRRFGRFPHRNAALGRPSTPDEEAFLSSWEGPPRIQVELLRNPMFGILRGIPPHRRPS
jgi:uncharacterized protein (DUF924 family)